MTTLFTNGHKCSLCLNKLLFYAAVITEKPEPSYDEMKWREPIVFFCKNVSNFLLVGVWVWVGGRLHHLSLLCLHYKGNICYGVLTFESAKIEVRFFATELKEILMFFEMA